MRPYSRKLAQSSKAFRALVGRSVESFEKLVEKLRPAFEANEWTRRARPPQGLPSPRGRPPLLDLDDCVIATLLFARFPLDYGVGGLLGVSGDTVRRAARRLVPLLRASPAGGLLTRLTTADGRKRLLRAMRVLPKCLDTYPWFFHMATSCGVWIAEDGAAFLSLKEFWT